MIRANVRPQHSSGTSYTLEMMHTITNQSMATNYGKEAINPENSFPRRPVFDDQPQGPFWLSDTTMTNSKTIATPSNNIITSSNSQRSYNNSKLDFVLTKTHCGSRCNRCSPQKFRDSVEEFITECAMEKRYSPAYSLRRVKRAVHLIRDPYDNVVARFHLLRNTGRVVVPDRSSASPSSSNTTVNTTRPVKPTSSGRDTFRNYCLYEHDLNKDNRAVMLDWLSPYPEQMNLLEEIPCGVDFLRYVLWHNRAFETCHELGLETLMVHYDMYERDFEGITSKILDFLHLEKVQEPAPFVPGKVYDDYYTAEERRKIASFLKFMASERTLNEISRYLS